MASVSLRPPPLWQSAFPFAEKHMTDLQIHAASVINLPITSSDYERELNLSTAAMKEFEVDIKSLVGLYAEAREHCLEYKRGPFREILTLSHALSSYSETVGTLYRSIDNLHQQKDGQQASCMTLLAVVIPRELERLIESGKKIVQGLEKLKNAIISSKLSLEKQRSALDSKSKDGRGCIADHVKTLKDISEAQDGKEHETQYWVPLVGFLPEAFLKDENGKKVIGDIDTFLALNDQRTTADALESMLLQVDLTIVSRTHFYFCGQGLIKYHKCQYNKILGLIELAVDTVESLCDPFQATIDGLNELLQKLQPKSGVENENNYNFSKTDEPLLTDLEDGVKEWTELGERAKKYSQVTLVMPAEANSVM